MKAILLNGSSENDTDGERIRAALTAELCARGWEVKDIRLCDEKIGNCAGDFFCWIRNPGICNVADVNRTLAQDIINSDLMIYLTPVTFGGYSYQLKKMVDHQIQNVTPFFAKVAGETHHQKRYRHYPDVLIVGWMEQPDPQAEAVFRHLAQRNAINFYARRAVTGIVLAGQPEDALRTAARGWLDDLEKGSPSRAENLPEPGATVAGTGPLQRAVLLVGSPRTRKSTSQSLGGYLFDRLAEHQVQTETFYIHTSLYSPERMQALMDAVDAADLVLLAFPLYVDSLPAPVMATLERIAARRHAQTGTRPRFAALCNCGFPEAAHNRTALAICETFARQAGFGWAGALSLGAGEGLVHGVPLEQAGGQAVPIKKALDLAAAALAQGQAVPQSAVNLLAKPVIPGWLYRWMGVYGWWQQARPYGVQNKLLRRAYTEKKLQEV
ncbi:MAG: NAD(P)H-dependent oxidoreductase [Anaerolineales bacterium]